MTKAAVLYCLEVRGMQVAKIGVTGNLTQRIAGLRSIAPIDMRLRHALEVGDISIATAWEKLILAKANRFKANGEWVRCDQLLDDLFAEVAPAQCVLNGTPAPIVKAGRPIRKMTDDEARSGIDHAVFVARVGPVLAFKVDNGDGDYRRALIRARLAQGFGWEDANVLDGITREEYFAEYAIFSRVKSHSNSSAPTSTKEAGNA